MTILLTLTAVLIILNFFLYKKIHQYKVYLFWIAAIIGAISMTQEINIINLGYVGLSFFLVVMYSGVVEKGKVKKSLVATRAEMAILGTIFIAVHGLKSIIYYTFDLKVLFSAPLSFYIGVISLLIAIPLFLTSFMKIRKKMKGKNWKRLHKLSYVFYLAVGLHLILIQNDRMLFYIGIFALYFGLRIWTYIESKKNKKSTKKPVTIKSDQVIT